MTKQKLLEKAQRCRPLLESQKITLDGPGTILKDVEVLLSVIGPGVVTGGKNSNLPPVMLPYLNERMSGPLELRLKRALLKDYPNIAGIYILLRVLGLVVADGKKIVLNSERMAEWNILNPVEQYFSLMEAWLLHAETDVLGGEARYREGRQIEVHIPAIATAPLQSWKDTHKMTQSVYWRLSVPDAWGFQLMSRFGLIKTRGQRDQRSYRTSLGWFPGQIKATAWGEVVAFRILEAALQADPEMDDSDVLFLGSGRDYDGLVRSAFHPYFPEFDRLFGPPSTRAVEGRYVFKVTLKGYTNLMRRIAFDAGHTLEDVALEVLQAFNFDADHAYVFSYRDTAGQRRKYLHPDCDEGPPAFDVTLGESGLHKGSDMRFRFDFGENWDFNLWLEKILPSEDETDSVTVLDSEGKPPDQYPPWDG